ncbi:MAG: hypothetical protein NZ805_08830 [Armatimonadetes bacterium]|nr:hypothetical protein [Armatimonadota bacterium]MDW8028211.1 hypothetical protein [Armatimonadota bacterium]
MMESIQVIVADDETLVRQSLAQLLNAEPDIEVVGVAADGRAGTSPSLSAFA